MSSDNLKPHAKTSSHIAFYVICAFFCGLYFARDIVGIKFSYYVIYVAAAIIIFCLSKEEAICFYLAISTFSGAGFNGVFCTILFGCILLRFFGEIKSLKTTSLLLLGMGVLEVIHCLSLGIVGIGSILTYALTLFALCIIQQYPDQRINKALIIKVFVAFSLFFVIIIMLKMAIEYGSLSEMIQNGFRTEEYAEIKEADGMNANQNYLTQLCSLNICLCVLMLSKKYNKLFYISAACIFIICALLTVSKMFIAVAIAIAIYIVFQSSKKNLIKGLGAVIVLAIIFITLYNLFNDSLIHMVIERFEEEDISTGRFNIISELLTYMDKNPWLYLYGTGIMQVHFVLDHAIHSSLFEVLAGWGILGLFLVSAYIVLLFNDSRKKAKQNNCIVNGYSYLPLLLLLAYTFIGMLFSQPFTIVQISVCMYAIQLKENQKNVVQYNNPHL